MKTSIYPINKGINKSIEFRGLKAQWIWWFGGLVIVLMLLFTVMYICGLGTLFCLASTGILAFWGSLKVFSLSKKYGEHGLKKMLAYRRLPKQVRISSRSVYIRLGWKDSKK
ncbi:DUF4133 domain-containing protein [Mucilaginibacter terrae]|uniref:DUF4133 domain-containing protein n=1 Tax=Mucilaginibacter terrae TaxID=1955052 RepID=A0ABU3GRA8_9SPHI|nr:DUF4133 domain-containing protein [Mucilaginibacter terrae]MDT3402317.1 hypothetical protein [Mucilaginibacter terrae]